LVPLITYAGPISPYLFDSIEPLFLLRGAIYRNRGTVSRAKITVVLINGYPHRQLI
jgi:hypothetical protein